MSGSSPFSSQSSTKLLPMKPAPPVTSKVTTASPSSRGRCAGALNPPLAQRVLHDDADGKQQPRAQRGCDRGQRALGLAPPLRRLRRVHHLDQRALAAFVGACQFVLACEQL